MAQELPLEEYTSLVSQEKGDLLQTVQRALHILNLVAGHPQGLSARQISEALGLNISTCYHILNTLVAGGYLSRQLRQQVYHLGPQIPLLNNAFMRGLVSQEAVKCENREENGHTPEPMAQLLIRRLRPILFGLTERTQEPSYLGHWQFGEVVLLSIAEASHEAKHAELYIGYQGPAHCRALGKMLLAYSDPAFVDWYLDTHPLISVGPNTIIQRLEFQEELNTIVQRGYSIDEEEFSSDTCCIAAPIFSPGGEVVAGLAISFTHKAFTKRAEWLATQVMRAAEYARAELRLLPTI